MAEPAKNRLIVTQDVLESEVASLVDSAPETLDTLNELAAALGNDPNFATTVSTQIGERVKNTDPRLSDARTPTAHTHTTGDVTGLADALAGKSNVGHSHEWSQITGKPSTFPPTIGTTASTAKAGNYVPAWSEVTGKPTTFAPSTHTHTKADVGLGNVDNTSDANKPVSTAQQTALDGKEKKAWQGTQAQYDALGTKDADRTYWIV